MTKSRVLWSLLSLLCACAVLCGCNTMEGLGKDTKKLGDKIEGAAVRNK
jgi:predicted small secreted protein